MAGPAECERPRHGLFEFQPKEARLSMPFAEADRFLSKAAERAAADAISQVRARAHAVGVRQLGRSLRRLGHLSARDRRVVETLSARVVNALLHEPTIALKRDPARGEQALALFGIERGPR